MSETKKTRTFEWANPLETAEKAKAMSGYDFLNGILKGTISRPPIAAALEFNPLAVEEGKVTFEFEPQEYHYNPIGSVHGGVISTLLDTAMGCALHSKLPQGTAYTTLELKVNFTKAVTDRCGKMKAEGRIIHLGKSIALVEADLKDDQGKLYAHSVSTCMILKF
ncbi:PaaI family thioesterase [Flavobacterium chungangense]|uniref:Thioesterase domain-containing protein n=1 Tax=Flavobacterium chungangense TaxID=554283 RepID=A0A6V6YZH8_9FLAO|nr:PaaI family thioesterase [Flavobacterium chungangense]CAD0004719.1 hypothetical protein FLACHUCJ7_01972 [Flavobacterium chungangense]